MVIPTSPPAGRHPRRSRAGQVVLGVLGALLVAGCGLVVTVVLLLTVGPGAFAAGLVAALIPVGPLLAVYRWLDRYEPEPRALLLFAFGWGATVAVAGALVLSLPPALAVEAAGGDADVVGAVVVAPVVEEALKALGFVAILVVGRRALDGMVDGVVYAGLVGVGFAFTENILYLGNAVLESGGEGLVATFLLRGVVSPFAHPLFTTATGIGLVLASRRTGAARYLLAAAGLLVAMLLHGMWNYLAVGSTMGFFGTFVTLWVPLFAAFVAVALVSRAREARMIGTSLAFYTRQGWLTPAEAQMLVSLPARQAAVTGAERVGAGRSMRRFQAVAARLAHLRHRIDRGTAPPDAAVVEAELGRDLVRERAALGAAYGGGPRGGGLPA